MSSTASSTVETRFMSLPDAARYSGMSASTLRRMAGDGKLRLLRPYGRILLIDRAELDGLLQQADTGTPAET